VKAILLAIAIDATSTYSQVCAHKQAQLFTFAMEIRNSKTVFYSLGLDDEDYWSPAWEWIPVVNLGPLYPQCRR
jgi:hypothetical protein